MASNRQKGSQYERELQLAFEVGGWFVHRAYPSLQRAGEGRYFSKDVDIFNVFDLICTRRSGGVLWVQVTMPSAATARRKKMKAFLDQLTTAHPIRVSSILAVRHPRKVWRMQALDSGGLWFEIGHPVDGLKRWVSKRPGVQPEGDDHE